ncbi:MAG: phospholipid/cholesterol/gamma-HCH transport system substrate-binding protein [Acidimicrobiaceae bacterium]|jgi:phospholipid/cholesterol/gamma-HCH transport system substrate-binding protein
MSRQNITLAQRIGIGLCAIVLVASVATVGIDAALGEYASVYTLQATFPRSGQGLDTFSSVKVRGVTVGSVSNIRLLPDGQAEITLHIHDDVHIPDTASASAEPLSVFGPKFIKLDPGEHELSGPYLHEGDRIAKTSPPTEITAVLGDASRLLDAINPDELRTVLHTLAQGLDGLGPELSNTVDQTTALLRTLAARDATLKQLLTDIAAISDTLGPRGKEIGTTAKDLNQVLPDIGQHGDELGQLLDATSRLSGDLADVVNGHAPALDQLINGLSPTVQALYDELSCIPGFLTANTNLIGLVGNELLAYHLGDGHWVGVVSGPFAVSALLTPPNTVEPVPVPPCGTG